MFQIKRYPLSTICILTVWFLSFFTPPKTELDTVPLIDKWVHMVMYGGTVGMIWLEYARSHSKANYRRLAMLGLVCPIIMSGAIELLQEYCTPNALITANRSGDWMDLLANSIGVALGGGVGMIFIKCFSKKDKEK